MAMQFVSDEKHDSESNQANDNRACVPARRSNIVSIALRVMIGPSLPMEKET
jgi:hypothetical protein